MKEEISSISGLTDPEEIKTQAERAVQQCPDGFGYEVTGNENPGEVRELALENWDPDAVWRERGNSNRSRASAARLFV